MEEKQKSKFGLGILVGVLITLVIGLSAFIIYDKVLNKTDNNTEIKEEIRDNQEENKNNEDVVLNYETVRVSEDLYYYKLIVNGKDSGLTGIISDVNKLTDALIFGYSETTSPTTIYIVDKDAKIVNSFIGNVGYNYKNAKEPYIRTKGTTIRNGYTISGNDIYIKSDNLEQDPESVVCNKKDQADYIVQYTEKFTYLGNGKFSDSVVTETTTVKEYMQNENIECRGSYN